jgi:hypothetical protein
LAVQPRAGLYSLPPDLYGSLQTGCGLAFLLGLCFSALPILTGDSLERNVRRYQSPDTDESAGGHSHHYAAIDSQPCYLAGMLLQLEVTSSLSCLPRTPVCSLSEEAFFVRRSIASAAGFLLARPDSCLPLVAALLAENIRWSVMGVLSVLPFINPMVSLLCIAYCVAPGSHSGSCCPG